VLAGDWGEFQGFANHLGEVEVGVYAVYFGQVLEELGGEGAGVWALLCGMLAGCMFVIFGRGTGVGGYGYLPSFRIAWLRKLKQIATFGIRF
jgi:hypothetical protein